MNVNVATLFSKDGSVQLNFYNGYLSLNFFAANGGDKKNFNPSGPKVRIPLKIEALNVFGRLCKDMLPSPMGKVKSLLVKKFNVEEKKYINVAILSLGKELKKDSLYNLHIHFVEPDIHFDYEFVKEGSIEITSEDYTVEQSSTDSFVTFFQVMTPQNLTILKAMSLDEKVGTVISKNGKMSVTQGTSDTYQPGEDDIQF